MRAEITELLTSTYGMHVDMADMIVDEIMAHLPPELSEGWVAENTDMREAIIDRIAPAVLVQWSKKNIDYGGQQVFLGQRAQFADINRKFWKLKQAMWDGVTPEFESVEEICFDMIGHLLMSIYQGDKEKWSANG